MFISPLQLNLDPNFILEKQSIYVPARDVVERKFDKGLEQTPGRR
jgi:hypothetical protein